MQQWMQQCQKESWTRSVLQSHSIRTLLVRRVLTTCWFLNHFKTALPLTHQWKTNRPWLEIRRVEQDDHEHPGWKIEVEAMFCTWCELSHTNKTDRGRSICWFLLNPDSQFQRFRQVWKRRRVLLVSLQSSIRQKRIAGLKN